MRTVGGAVRTGVDETERGVQCEHITPERSDVVLEAFGVTEGAPGVVLGGSGPAVEVGGGRVQVAGVTQGRSVDGVAA